MKQVMR